MKPSFTLTIPPEHHDQLLAQLAALEHVDVDVESKSGEVRHDSGAKFAFQPGPGADEVTVEVVDNPRDVALTTIREQFEADMKRLIAA